MIPGDEGKPMSILERISDAPRDAEPYLEYLIHHYLRHREYWKNDVTADTVDRGCVVIKIEHFLFELEDILSKLRRERAA